MQSLSATRPSPASQRFFRLCAELLSPVQKRQESTYRRARSKLNIKPDPAFVPTKTEQHDHIIYNPPPSMPNVYHTPTIFLPHHDKRRAIQAALQPLPQMQLEVEKLYRVDQKGWKPPQELAQLKQADVDEIRRLRLEDPVKWTQNRLADNYNCSNTFVGRIIKGLSKEKTQQQRAVTEVVRSSWGNKRRIAREDREIRKDKWYRDE